MVEERGHRSHRQRSRPVAGIPSDPVKFSRSGIGLSDFRIDRACVAWLDQLRSGLLSRSDDECGHWRHDLLAKITRVRSPETLLRRATTARSYYSGRGIDRPASS